VGNIKTNFDTISPNGPCEASSESRVSVTLGKYLATLGNLEGLGWFLPQKSFLYQYVGDGFWSGHACGLHETYA
jgi:hypothetical protein